MKKWTILLALLLCVAAVGCGTDEENLSPSITAVQTTSTTAVQIASTTGSGPLANAGLKVEDCYTYTENADGTYSYEVEWRGGDVLCAESGMDRPVYFTAIDEDLLVIYGQAGTGAGARWARVCDIERGRVSEVFGSYLAAVGNRVAYLELRTDRYHVFVVDAFDAVEPLAVHTLEGASLDEDPIQDFSLSEEGVLSVTYSTDSGSKTISVEMKKE